jgi:hypothetical protein
MKGEHAIALRTHLPMYARCTRPNGTAHATWHQPPLARKRPSPGWLMWKRSSNACHLSKSLSLGRYESKVRVCSPIDKCQIHQLRLPSPQCPYQFLDTIYLRLFGTTDGPYLSPCENKPSTVWKLLEHHGIFAHVDARMR